MFGEGEREREREKKREREKTPSELLCKQIQGIKGGQGGGGPKGRGTVQWGRGAAGCGKRACLTGGTGQEGPWPISAKPKVIAL